jgi:hypothetical protein
MQGLNHQIFKTGLYQPKENQEVELHVFVTKENRNKVEVEKDHLERIKI